MTVGELADGRGGHGGGATFLGLAVGVFADGGSGSWGRSGSWGHGASLLGLAVGVLADGRGHGATFLGLAIRVFADGGSRSGGGSASLLGLAVGVLADSGGRSGGGSASLLRLAVGVLADSSGRSGSRRASLLRLAVLVLADSGGGASLLGLTIGVLADGRADGAGGGLTIRLLGGNDGRRGRRAAAGRNNSDVNGVALAANGGGVKVVEATAQALVPDGAGESEGAVAADGETAGVDGVALERSVELELLVGGDITLALLGVGQDTVGEGQDEGGVVAAVILSLFETALGGAGDVHGLDLERAAVVLRAASGGAAGSFLGNSQSRKGEGCECVTHSGDFEQRRTGLINDSVLLSVKDWNSECGW